MKLRNLNGKIRANDGSVKLRIATADGSMIVGLVKSELMAGLATLYPDPTAETSLTIIDGRLTHESGVEFSTVHGPIAAAVSAAEFHDADLALAEAAIEGVLNVGADDEIDLLADEALVTDDVEDLLA